MTDIAQGSLAARVMAVLQDPDRWAVRGLPWRLRPAQCRMGEAVAETIGGRGVLAVEAGPGVGKSMAYLVPLLLSGERGTISTGTRLLQDQLMREDIPRAVRACGKVVRVECLKGRHNYVCAHRVMESLALPPRSLEPRHAAGVASVHAWMSVGGTGDLSTWGSEEQLDPLRPWITTDESECLGSSCPRLSDCAYRRARERAQCADLVVVNHALLLSDPWPERSGEPDWLQGIKVIVVDEAHRLVRDAPRYLGISLRSAQLELLASELEQSGRRFAPGLAPWDAVAQRLRLAVMRPVSVMRAAREAGAFASLSGAVQAKGLEDPALRQAIRELSNALHLVVAVLEGVEGSAAELSRLFARAKRLREVFWLLAKCFDGQADGSSAQWLEFHPRPAGGIGWQWSRAGSGLSSWLEQLRQPGDACVRSLVFTSATLGEDIALSWLADSVGPGLTASWRTMKLPSPHLLPERAGLHVPSHLPDPDDPLHLPLLAQAVARWSQRLGGRTMVLCTSRRAARTLAVAISDALVASTDAGRYLEVLHEQMAPRHLLLDRLQQMSSHHQMGAVLVASMGFWEGVDLPGEQLQLLVIDKLPFAPPDDPIEVSRGRMLRSQGLDPFAAGQVPGMLMTLRQGLGRLLRHEHDRGVAVIADRRLLSRSYGPRVLAALTGFRRLESDQALLQAIDQLAESQSVTTASTRDRHGA